MVQLGGVLRRVGLWRRTPPPWRAGYVVAKDPPGAAPWRRALAATGDPAAADALARAWDELTPRERAAVWDPVTELGRDGRQATGRTCGAAVLTMLAAQGDPLLALWLASGRLLAAERPPELAGAPDDVLRRLRQASTRTRFAVVHRVVHRRATRRAVAGLPWPEALGTPPWALARSARYLGVLFTHAVLDDSDPAALEAGLVRVGAAVDAGIPVPLLTGGDSSRGWGTAVPRHVVLAVAERDGGLDLWEPGRGAVVHADAAVLRGGAAHPALGNWAHLTWAVLPR
ncbi:hypothetical protein [Actinotalea fermentans]|uniref:Uncharacterized protein n=1 Tax=Actinotalea fermentans TaxID=43671 RepID=A0A511YWP8_9CELL|nr:hypothetical protein [Actinotalea fermentans]GEN79599.1 hypothetical protein AFE02nite_13330 [Actinotalea fermentans]